ncbi:hypothetical protein M885DRAFT_585447 [Pelagophyceae sp. CCMP2097]|nr:hypothetical protein M885DRAFT_585447 [Pelagophyceae sp. CCMP2097]|mmetsp:Transcript_4616/g.16459  ORF Transcript_4616/g.16459 Transcript_4616/m.16459 type:complete len:222 (-) Transcript_4616:20-685(-)
MSSPTLWILLLALADRRIGAAGLAVGRRRAVGCRASSVGDYVGNQHGGKYQFDASVEAAASGADYGAGRREDPAAMPAWAYVLGPLRDAETFEALVAASAASSVQGPVFADGGRGAMGEVDIRNDEATWETAVAAVVGPARARFAIVAALGSMSATVEPGQEVVTSLPPRRGGGRGVTLQIRRAPGEFDAAAWAALVVVREDAAPRLWRLTNVGPDEGACT